MIDTVNEKKSSTVDLRKKWKLLFEPNWRIITQEEYLRKL